MLPCQICGENFIEITGNHVKKHNLTLSYYKTKYGKTSSPPSQKIIARLGSCPDTHLAKELNCSFRLIGDLRKKHSIPKFKGLYLTQEGESCRSILEAKYDAYLHWKKITHQHEVPVLSYIADFKIKNSYVEIAGMVGFDKYDKKLKIKKKTYKNNNIDVIWLTASDVENRFKDCPIKLKFNVNRICDSCGKATYDLVKKKCRDCYMIAWHQNTTTPQTCKQCSNEFFQKEPRQFCSHPCYAKSLEFSWPPWGKLDKLLETKSIKQIAFDLEVEPGSLYMRLHRRKNRQKSSAISVLN